ncbi:MAG: phage shock protein operon transcriptional activator [Alphaproteobacteria bacterium RIFCSPHIGHO2_12_FULL_63_12]|nr:MAG: phage shock protein operon transcriptional activator [Alphaproteobacteria bacterium RIFCSPHIGHO2_12_FULL_63_12]
MSSPRQPPELIGQSPIFLDALAHASSAATLDRPLLICGERGSGKELIAGRVHFLSPRWEAPFVKLNCAALSDELLDSELFGHEAGAFTGATKRHAGRFERAEGGTLFLDEIATASLRIQEKLLRVIEYGEYERVGGGETRVADVRIVAAANADLPALAAAGKFRADLLDRLAFDVVAAPPLRARKEDIPILAAHFASGLARELGARFDGFTPEAMAILAAHHWPGNVRELKNAAERSFHRWIAGGESGPIGTVVIDPFAVLAGAEIEPSASRQPRSDKPAATFDLRRALNDAEKEWTERALARCAWNQKDAAASLGLTYDQIRGLIRKHGLSRIAARHA